MRIRKKISMILSFLLVFSMLLIDVSDIGLAKNVNQEVKEQAAAQKNDCDVATDNVQTPGAEIGSKDAIVPKEAESETSENTNAAQMESTEKQPEKEEVNATEGAGIIFKEEGTEEFEDSDAAERPRELEPVEKSRLEMKRDDATVIEVSDLDSFIQAVAEVTADDDLTPAYEFTADEAAATVEGKALEMPGITDKSEGVFYVPAEIVSEDTAVDTAATLIDTFTFANQRLIVISEQGFDPCGATTIIQGYNNIFVLSYGSPEDTKAAYDFLSTVPELKVEADITLETSEVSTVEGIESALADQEVETDDNYANDLKTSFTEIPTVSRDINIAVLDTGYDYDSCDTSKLLEGIDISGSGSVQDSNGHGTAMSNIIRENSSENIKIMPVKIADPNGRTSVTKLYLGVMYAMEHDADIINISMNAYKADNSGLLDAAINQATAEGVYVVVSAGNSSDDVINYAPADNENSIVVSAINTDNTIMDYSNYGATVDFSTYGKVMTTGMGNAEIEATGTSVSAAIMSMQIAQLLLMDNALTYDVLMQRLIESAADFGEEGRDDVYGYGAVTPEIINALYDSNVCKTAQIFSVDWKNTSDEELNNIIENTNDVNLTKFLKDLSQEDKNTLIARETKLKYGYVVATGKMDGQEFDQKEYASYYEYLMDYDVAASWYATDGATQKGYFYIESPSGSCKVSVSYTDLKTSKNDKDSTSTKVSYSTNLTGLGGGSNFSLSNFGVTKGTDVFHVYLGMNVKFDVDKHSKLSASASLGSGTNGAGITTFGASHGMKVSCTKENTVWGNSGSETTGCQVAFNETGISLDGGKPHNATVKINMSENQSKSSYKFPTCTQAGYDEYKCSSCNTKWRENKPAVGHFFPGNIMYEANNGIPSGMKYEQCRRNCGEPGWKINYQYKQQIFYRYMDMNGNYPGYDTHVDGYYTAGTYIGEFKHVDDGSSNFLTAGVDAFFSPANANSPIYIDIARKKYSIVYNGNGATNGSTASQYNMCCGNEFGLSGNGFERKFNLVFYGNGGNADGTGGDDKDKIQKDANIIASSDFLYWTSDVGVFSNVASVVNLSLTNGATINMYAQWNDKTVKLPIGAREGYNFLGWSTNQNAKTPDSGYEIGKSIPVNQNKNLYAVWKIITYPVIYHSNDGTNQEISELKTWGQPYTIKENSFTRDGYDFAGWSTNPDLNIVNGNPEYKPKDEYTQNADLTLYAVWAQRFNVAYIGNEQTLGDDFVDAGNEAAGISQLDEYTFNGNENELQEKIFTKDSTASYIDEETGEEVVEDITSTVVSWGLGKEVNVDWQSYELSAIKSAAEIYDEANIAGGITIGTPNEDYGKYPLEEAASSLLLNEFKGNSNNIFSKALKGADTDKLKAGVANTPYINLYSVWDDGPLVKAYDLYYSLQFAQSTTDTKGITFDELLSKVEVTDQEDEHIEMVYEIPAEEDRAEKTTYVTVVGYSAGDFTGFTSDGSVSVTFRAVDSVGNITEKMIKVYVADSAPQKVKHREYTRFIDEKYYKSSHEQGGLEEKSLWLTDAEYVNAIQTAFENARNNTPEEVYEFSREQILQMQNFVKENGIGNSMNPDALTRFYETFLR